MSVPIAPQSGPAERRLDNGQGTVVVALPFASESDLRPEATFRLSEVSVLAIVAWFDGITQGLWLQVCPLIAAVRIMFVGWRISRLPPRTFLSDASSGNSTGLASKPTALDCPATITRSRVRGCSSAASKETQPTVPRTATIRSGISCTSVNAVNVKRLRTVFLEAREVFRIISEKSVTATERSTPGAIVFVVLQHVGETEIYEHEQ
jgi:hypothetical protein